MDYPLYVENRKRGTLRLTAMGNDTCFEVLCPALTGLHRVYAQGERGRLLLGVLEGGHLRRRFSETLTAPIGRVLCGRTEESAAPAEGAWTDAPDETHPQFPPLPPETLFCRRGGRYYLAIPYAEGEPFPLEELFCFARVCTVDGRLRAVFAFDRQGNPCLGRRR
ncbi:MAG: hypothetical protein KBS74_08985 [Clostridiales bacterium]|nr:hypothetical protein [Candidatus Cacconaster stercorequi]